MISLIQKAQYRRSKINNKTVAKLVKLFKKELKYSIKKGLELATIDISDTNVPDVQLCDYINIYEKAIEILDNYYNGEVLFDIEKHGYLYDHKRLRGVLKESKETIS